MLHQFSLLNDGATIVVESDSIKTLQNLGNCYIIEKSKKYGIAFVDILTYKC
jgi:16S rRNA G966 N2-methylase RsmD